VIAGGANPRLGILLKVASVLGFTLMSACVKAGAGVVPIAEVCFFRSFFALLTIIAILAWQGEFPAAIHTRNPWGHFWRGLLGLTAMGFNFAAIAYLPLPDAIALGYAMPFFLAILAALMLRETVRAYRWTGVLIGLVGVMIILWPRLTFLKGEGASDEAFGAFCALAGALMVALGSVVTSRLVVAERTTTVVFYFSLIGSLGFLATLPFGWRMPDPATFTILVLSGVLGGVSQLLLTQCYRYADTSTVAPFEYSSMLFGIALGYFLFSEVPTLTMLIGSSVVIAAGLFVIWREQVQVARRAASSSPPTQQPKK
jgi:drug/metabolite transporter (DMT)-like permease